MTSPIAPTQYPPASNAMLASRTSEAIGRNPDRRTGVVTAIDGGVVTVQIAGGATERVSYLATYAPVVGDVVALIQQRSTWLCLGRIPSADEPAGPFADAVYITPPNINNATTSFADITNVTFDFIKRSESSRVFAQIGGSCYTGTVGAAVELAVRINSVDHVLAFFFFNQANVHHSWSGFRYLTGIPAGVHTVIGRFRAPLGGTISLDGNDRVSLMCAEAP